MKQDIFNLIVLDESGSMSCVRNQTISGCNETINTIRYAQEKFADTQRHYVSIYAFQSGGRPSRYLIKNVPIADVRHITEDDYEPCGGTPLYDAVGSTISDLKVVTKAHDLAIGSVTIITDGMENSSRHYSGPQVAKMIDELKEMGWTFSFIGANIDVEAAAQSLNIENHLEFTQDDQGTREMFVKEQRARMGYMERMNDVMMCHFAHPDNTKSGRKELLKKMRLNGENYFDEKA